MSEEEHNLVSARGPFGRCSLLAPANTIADAAFLSSWLCTREALQQHADAMGRPLQNEPEREEAQRARNNLQHAGVNVDERGKIELSDEAKHTMEKAQWIMKDNEEANKPAEQVDGPALRTLSNLAQIGAAERWTQSNEEEKARRLGARHQTAPSCPTHIKSRLHQHPAAHQMQTQGDGRLTLRDNGRPKRDAQPALQAGNSTNATSQSSSKHRCTRRPRESHHRTLHLAGAERSAWKQYSTQRSGGPRLHTTDADVTAWPPVMEAASRHLQPRTRNTSATDQE